MIKKLISPNSMLGKIVRLPLKLLPGRLILRIFSGLNKGKKWRIGSSINGCWLGIYEKQLQNRLPQLVKPGMVCWDVGANVGFYTLALSKLAGKSGTVIAFEPNSRNMTHLLEHININNLINVSAFQFAFSDKETVIGFDVGNHHATGRISQKSKYFIPAFSGDYLVSNNLAMAPDFIKIDIEGAEGLFLKGFEKTIKQKKPTILLSLHGIDAEKFCVNFLKKAGYKITNSELKEFNGENDLIAVFDKEKK